MRVFGAVLLALLAVPTLAVAKDYCPQLPAGTKLKWEQKDWPDFTVCYAMDASKRQIFGLYSGMAADFQPKKRINAEKSLVGGFRAQWVRANESGKSAEYREALVIVNTGKGPIYQAHVWIHADNKTELKYAMMVLSAIRFRDW